MKEHAEAARAVRTVEFCSLGIGKLVRDAAAMGFGSVAEEPCVVRVRSRRRR